MSCEEVSPLHQVSQLLRNLNLHLFASHPQPPMHMYSADINALSFEASLPCRKTLNSQLQHPNEFDLFTEHGYLRNPTTALSKMNPWVLKIEPVLHTRRPSTCEVAG
ncbi:hypothetical protein GJ744_002700 [Endocarpon pusillum]|uniref:Uncharacterized protein n=1 Tax=Endocarpon pusillum TaxID=364733 RepID=A0A8H7AS66_9EURO|nr:hypothetical protein GJ744_002700 [Endocarpon pusillum]